MSSGQYQILRQQICEIGHRLYQRGYISGAEGNISVRLDDSSFLCTPTSVSKGFLAAEQVARIDANAKLLEGPLNASSECRMHLAIYQAQPAAMAVVHAHPPYAVALGVANVSLPMDMVAEGLGYMGEVPLLPFEVPSTVELARQVAQACQAHRVIMMKNHGATAWGETLEQAWMLMEVLEACCKVTYLTRTLGRMDPLPPEKIAALPRARPVGTKG